MFGSDVMHTHCSLSMITCCFLHKRVFVCYYFHNILELNVSVIDNRSRITQLKDDEMVTPEVRKIPVNRKQVSTLVSSDTVPTSFCFRFHTFFCFKKQRPESLTRSSVLFSTFVRWIGKDSWNLIECNSKTIFHYRWLIILMNYSFLFLLLIDCMAFHW